MNETPNRSDHADRELDTEEARDQADVALTPTRFVLDGFAAHSQQPELLAPYPRLRAYPSIAQRDPALGRIWQEMTDGLKVFLASTDGSS